MKPWLRRGAMGFAVVLVGLSLFNASWRAEAPAAGLSLIAHRGASQLYTREGLTRDTCTATRIEAPVHPYLENTAASIKAARELGANAVEVDIAPTRDGQIVLFHDWTLDCRTNGKGETRDNSLAELKALDIGYGYTADGGKTFPFRGKGIGQMPTLDEGVKAAYKMPLVFNFKSRDPAEADALAAALKAAGRDVEKIGDSFYGDARPIARIRQLFPKAWAWSKDSAEACTKGYLKAGWFGIIPEACRNGTLIVPLNYQWAFAGWPNLTQARMADVGARIVIVGPLGGNNPRGLALPEQLGKVPMDFKGYLWVDDIYAVGPALRPHWNHRSEDEDKALDRQLEARRKRID